jgi:hypothetical protein
MKMRINIEITDNEGIAETHAIDVEAELPETGDLLIDNVEKEILKLNKQAIRQAIEVYLEELSKKKPELRKPLMEGLSRLIPPPTESTEK